MRWRDLFIVRWVQININARNRNSKVVLFPFRERSSLRTTKKNRKKIASRKQRNEVEDVQIDRMWKQWWHLLSSAFTWGKYRYYTTQGDRNYVSSYIDVWYILLSRAVFHRNYSGTTSITILSESPNISETVSTTFLKPLSCLLIITFAGLFPRVYFPLNESSSYQRMSSYTFPSSRTGE